MRSPMISNGQIGQTIGAGILMVPLVMYSYAQWQRPPQTSLTQSLFHGITYERTTLDRPSPLMMHIVTVDLGADGIDVLVSPGQPGDDNLEFAALKTSEFLVQHDLQVAVNANFFYPFKETTPWNFYPHSGDRTNVLGTAISDGNDYSPAEAEWPALCIDADNRARIAPNGLCPEGTQQAIAGNQLLLQAGIPVPFNHEDRAYGRVMVAVNGGGDRLWLVVADGKQPHYSEGATLGQLIDVAQRLGADAALNLDGGGSATLVIESPQGSRLLNAPIHTKLPLRERPVANHIGFRASPDS